jgi:hypothetical protein
MEIGENRYTQGRIGEDRLGATGMIWALDYLGRVGAT